MGIAKLQVLVFQSDIPFASITEKSTGKAIRLVGMLRRQRGFGTFEEERNNLRLYLDNFYLFIFFAEN